LAYGLRNPWRFSFDALNGDLYAADVGQNQVEEIDHITKGGNYGWRVMEGNICTPGVNPNCKPDKSMIAPIETYTHAVGYSVTGGYVYRGDNLKGLCGVYLYADYVTQRLWGLRYDGKMVTQQRELMKLDASVSSFGEDADHELYIVDHRGGQILKFVP
jgi:glucose/arabinose dehydrogenase